MKELLDELLVQACAAQQQTDLAALEQLAPANVPMPFVPQVRLLCLPLSIRQEYTPYF